MSKAAALCGLVFSAGEFPFGLFKGVFPGAGNPAIAKT